MWHLGWMGRGGTEWNAKERETVNSIQIPEMDEVTQRENRRTRACPGDSKFRDGLKGKRLDGEGQQPQKVWGEGVVSCGEAAKIGVGGHWGPALFA